MRRGCAPAPMAGCRRGADRSRHPSSTFPPFLCNGTVTAAIADSAWRTGVGGSGGSTGLASPGDRGRSRPQSAARDRWSDKVQGFDAGADDYVAKPFHLEEVLARIRALLRRSAGHAKSELNCGAVRLDTRTGRVTVDGNPVKLTSHEYRLLSYLMHHAGRVVSRSELVEHLYDQDFDRDSNTIEVFVGRIRKKLGVDIIQTVRGLGYLLTPPGNAS